MTFQSLDSSPVASVEVPPGAAILRRGAVAARTKFNRYGLLLAFLAFWQIGSTQGWINPTVFPPLDKILAATWEGLVGGALLDDIAISLQRSGLAFAAAVGLAIPLGLFMGQIRAVEQALDPILQFFRQTSALALYPVFILLLGLGEASKVFVIFWATLFPILLATIGGVKEVDRKLIEMAATFGASRTTIFRRVVLPASVPSIFVGLRLSATTALLLLIAAEMIGANKGLGFQVMNAQYNFQIPQMFAAILLLAALGLTANALLVTLQRRLCRWADLTH
ncbi:ABC transporter permease [Rhodobacter sp. SY28-1]|uniref:ABC transporter permease n=1 Tax=Rhodobacter sp. SY28-1 TaxID=2562317 RepID=UPI0010C01268|nr:ABC transporter permease [Rhodobacter sp. SY28-1]